MPDYHLLNGLFSHGEREKYPPAALNWVLAVPNLIHTYIHIRDAETVQRIQILHHNYYHWCFGCCPKDTQTQPRKATPTKGENKYHNPEDTESCPNWNFKNMQDCH